MYTCHIVLKHKIIIKVPRVQVKELCKMYQCDQFTLEFMTPPPPNCLLLPPSQNSQKMEILPIQWQVIFS